MTMMDPVRFDYDGDGEPEIFVGLRVEIYEQGRWSRGRLWTYAHGSVGLYEPAKGIDVERVEDIDLDGRPDLVTLGGYKSSNWCWGTAGAPLLVAHALPNGTFSMDDAVAKAFARRSCPSPPKPPFVVNPYGSNKTERNSVVCALLWGVPRATIEASLATDAGAGDIPCDDVKAFREWVRRAPPLDLR